MDKMIATLRSSPPASVEVPAVFPRKRGVEGESRSIERSVFGALRFFPGIPKTISADEVRYLRHFEPAVFARLDLRKYVASKRVDYRGKGEKEIEALAAKEGIAHLPLAKQVERLVERKKLEIPPKSASSRTEFSKPRKGGNGNGGKKPAKKPA